MEKRRGKDMDIQILDDKVPNLYPILTALHSLPYYYGERDNSITPPTGMVFTFAETDTLYTDIINLCYSHFSQLEGLNPYRVYVNYFSATENSYYHVDNSVGYTVLIYVNEEVNVDEGGETQFYNEVDHSIYGVLPKPGRMVCFDASILHRATPFKSRSRFTIAAKFM